MRARAGFTLLEVLAAVLVVGMVFTVLAGANIDGLRAEGLAARRLEASLVADRTLSELEAGVAPPLGTVESELDGFRVRVEVTPYELAPEPLPGEPAQPAVADEGPTLLAAPGSGALTPLRRVAIQVLWDDGVAEHAVRRDSIAFDGVSVASLVAGIGAEEETPQ